MKMRVSVLLVPVFCFCLLPISASAQTALVAAETGVTTHSPCPSFCGGSGGVFNSDFDGGVGLATSFSSLDNLDGDGQALAELLGPTELPILKAEAFSHAEAPGQRSSRVSAQAFGLQGFYVPEDSYSLDVTLSGIANDLPEPPGVFNEDGNVNAQIMIIRDNDPSTVIEYTSHYATMKFENIPLIPDLELLTESVGLSITPDNVAHAVSDTLIASDLNYGDLIYVWSSLNVSGTRGGFGDAFDTLTMQFQNSQGLSHDPLLPIPEPSALLLMLVGLGMQGLVARHRVHKADCCCDIS